MKPLQLLIFPGMVILLLLASCNKPAFFESEHHFGGSWADGDTASYAFAIADTTHVFDVELNIVFYREVFPYQNLYVKTITTFPDGDTHEQILSLNLFTRIGYVKGSCSGEECKVEIPIQEQIFFPQTGNYTLQIIPWMRIAEVPGMKSLALSLHKLDLERSPAADPGNG